MLKLLTLTAAGILLIGATQADDHKGPKGDQKENHYAKMDHNKDGFVTKKEMLKAHEKRIGEHFSKMDKDGNGKLSKKEMQSGRKMMKKEMKKRMGERNEHSSDMKEKREDRREDRREERHEDRENAE